MGHPIYFNKNVLVLSTIFFLVSIDAWARCLPREPLKEAQIHVIEKIEDISDYYDANLGVCGIKAYVTQKSLKSSKPLELLVRKAPCPKKDEKLNGRLQFFCKDVGPALKYFDYIFERKE